MSFNRWGSIVDGVDPVNTTETSISEIRSDGVSIYHAIPDSVVLDYHLSEESGQTLNDEIEGATASVENSPTWVSDSTSLGGFYLDLTGDGDSTGEIEIADTDRSFSDLMSVGTTGEAGFAFTVEFSTFINNYPVRFGTPTERAYLLYLDSGLQVGAGDDANPTGFDPTIGTRYRIAAFWDNNNNNWKFYVNAGTPQASGSFAGTADFSGVWKIILGSYEANVSSFCFFDSYPTDSDVQADYDRLPWS